jgi:hypothetical protein
MLPMTDNPDIDSWTWWQSRRLRYNLGLGAAGVVAYAVTVGLWWSYGQLLWRDWRDAASMTIFLGILYLLLMGLANICYLIGQAMEAWVKPPDRPAYRKSAYALGFWTSLAVPFAFPALNLALLIGQHN